MTSENYRNQILEDYKNGLATKEEMSSLLMTFAMQYHKEQLRLLSVSVSLQSKTNAEILNGIQNSDRYALPREWEIREHTNTNYMGGFLNGVKWREKQ